MRLPQDNETDDLNPTLTAYCPHCKTITSLAASSGLQTVIGTDGKAETVMMTTFHCETCRLFVRCEEHLPYVDPLTGSTSLNFRGVHG